MARRDAEEGSEDHLAIVQRVKAVQRESDQGRNQWHNFCDTSGKGTRDPSRHPASFLRAFFEALRDGSIPQGLEALHERPLPELSDDPKEALPILVAKVKQGQRTSVEFKQRWWNYADTQHDGIRDPSKHDVASLRRFLSEVAPGGALPTAGVEAPAQLAERVKQMQRQSEQVKQQWWWYCDTFGAGVRDPNRHQEAFLQQFLSMAEAQGAAGAVTAASYGKALDVSAYRYSPYDQGYAAAAAAQAYAACPAYAQAYAAPGYPAQGYATPAAAYGAVPSAYGAPPSAAAAAAAAYGAAAYPSAYSAYALPGMQPGLQPTMQPGMQPGMALYGMAAAPAVGSAVPALGTTALPGMGTPPVAGAAPGMGAYAAQTAVADAAALAVPAALPAAAAVTSTFSPLPSDLAAASPQSR